MTCSGLVYLLPLLLQILAVQSIVQNVTRLHNGDDIFANPDNSCESKFCGKYNGIKVGGSWMATCKCSCNYGKTFVVHNTSCLENSEVHSNLLASLQTKDASFRVTRDNTCPSFMLDSVMPVLDITRKSHYTLCLPMTDITKCNIIKKDSLYFYEGKWYPIWPTNRKQDTFIITEDDSNSILKWTSLGQQFTGLIFALKISCELKGPEGSSTDYDNSDTIGSYLIFKSAGSHYFNGNKPTLAPISSAPKESSSPTPQSSTTASSSQSDEGKNSSKSKDKGLIAGLTICAILVIIVIIALVVFYLRRKRNDEKPSKGAECEANPTYDLGQDRSLPVTVNGQTPPYDYPDTSTGYQPLVQNTRMRDASGKVPVYTSLNRETKNNNSPVLQMETHGKRGLAYETVAIPIQQPAKDESVLAESPDYEDPTNPTIPNEGGLYAISAAQDGNTIDFENTAYKDPESVIKIG